jgi:hypothetical protein
MAASDAEICNIALQRVGVTLTIDTLGQRVKEAIVCNLIYATTREKVLTDGHWPFARKYQPLNLSGVAPLKWKYRYVYPNDCLAVRGIFPDLGAGVDPAIVREYARQHRTPFEIVLDDNDDMTICTDLADASIEFTRNVTNPARLDAQFVSAFAWAIAAEIALPLSRDVKYMQNALSMYDREIGQAMAKALNEEGRQEDPESEFVRERY